MSGYITTPNLGLLKPTVGADDDAWGGHLNQNADTLDTQIATKTYTDARRRRFLNAVTSSIPNVGASTAEEVAAVWTLPAGLLANVGDVLHASFMVEVAGTTDAKTFRLRLTSTSNGTGGFVIALVAGSAVGSTRLHVEAWVIKTGSNTQRSWNFGVNATNNVTASDASLTLTDTGALYLGLTVQNATAATPGSLTIFAGFLEYLPAV